jgi:hypothetical protein
MLRTGMSRPCSHSADFGVRMSNQQTRFAQIGALRRGAPLLALLAVLAPPAVHAQVNIDQDKTPAHIYESDCAVCHKAIRGLANGRSRTALTAYLTEHYTSSDSEAQALAAYVLSGGGGVGRPASGRDLLAAPDMQRNAAGTSGDREQRGSQNRLPARERVRRQGRAMKRPGAPQKPAATSGIPASNRGPATATVAPAAAVPPAAPAAGPSEPPATPATRPGEAPSGVNDNIAD